MTNDEAELAKLKRHKNKEKRKVTPKPNQRAPEKDFMRRWVDKRSADLAAQGKSPDVAHDQAVAEFKATYTYMKTAQQAR